MSSSSIQHNPSVVSSYSVGDNVTGNDTLNVTQSTLPKVQSLASDVQSNASANLQVTEPTLKVDNKTINKPLPDVTPNVLQKNSELVGTNIQQSTIENSKHPHLGEEFTDPISQMFTEKPSSQEAGQAMFNALKERGIINANGELNYEALGVAKKAKAAHMKGKVFVTENGFDFNIRGRCGNDAVEVMTAFKEALEKIQQENPEQMKDINISIEPNAVATPSETDLQVLGRGGQIQYKPLPDGQVIKMVLDPGENGEEDGLSVSVYDKGMKNENVKTIKVPLKVVFEGGEYGDDKTRALKDNNQALLPNWRNQRLFENSSIQKEYTAFIPGVHHLSRKDKDNTGDVNRIQAQNQLWNAVYEYLKIKVDSKDNEFIVNNKKINENAEKKDQAIQQPNVNETDGKQNTSDVKLETATKVPAPEKGTIETGNVSDKKGPRVTVKVTKKTKDSHNRRSLLDAAKKLSDTFASIMDSCSPDEKKRLDPIASELKEASQKGLDTIDEAEHLNSILAELKEEILPKDELDFDPIDETEHIESSKDKVIVSEKATVETENVKSARDRIVVQRAVRRTTNRHNLRMDLLNKVKEMGNTLATAMEEMNRLDHPIVNEESLRERLREIGTTFMRSVNDETKSRWIDEEIAKDIGNFKQIIDKYADNYMKNVEIMQSLNHLKLKFDNDLGSIRNKRITDNELNFMRQITESFNNFEAVRDKA